MSAFGTVLMYMLVKTILSYRSDKPHGRHLKRRGETDSPLKLQIPSTEQKSWRSYD